jgi:P27 family predicted phage terminase small subunit
MGKRGPQPKPTALRVFEGTRIQRPTIRDGEPVPDAVETPVSPDWLGTWGKAAWDRMGPQLSGTKLLTEADYDLFAQWCFSHDVFHEARLDLAKFGLCFETEKGRQANPAAKIMNAQTGIIIKIGQLFGMGPSSRVGLTAPTQDSGYDDLDSFKRTAVSG